MNADEATTPEQESPTRGASTPSADKPKIGFVGLGIMGLPMALNVLQAGYPVVGYNRSPQAVSTLQSQGGTVADSVAAVGEAADVVITMLPASPDVIAVVTGAAGLLESARSSRRDGLTIIDMSTIHPGVAREVAEKAARQGVRVLDAPVSGGQQGAIDGVLSVMVGGHAEDFEAQLPLLQTMGKTVRHVGPHGAGQTVKAVNQLLVGGHLQLLAEGLTLLEALDVEPGAALDVLGGGLAASRVLEVKADNMLSDSFEPGFRVALHHKDLGIVMETAREAQVTLPATALVAQFMAAAVARGRGGADHSVLIELVREMSARGRAST